MSTIVKTIDRLPFWVWPPAGAVAGVLAGAVITAGQALIGALL